LHFFVSRFSNRAPYWQFVLWIRQIAIVFIALFFATEPIIMIVLATIACICFLVWHLRVQPFVHDFQNNVESVLLASSIVLLILCGIYSELTRKKIMLVDSAISIVFSIVIFLILFGSLIGGVYYLKLWTKMKESFIAMLKETDEKDKIRMAGGVEIVNHRKSVSNLAKQVNCSVEDLEGHIEDGNRRLSIVTNPLYVKNDS
jgi:hypothetical protein